MNYDIDSIPRTSDKLLFGLVCVEWFSSQFFLPSSSDSSKIGLIGSSSKRPCSCNLGQSDGNSD